jgi:hypothetical protein
MEQVGRNTSSERLLASDDYDFDDSYTVPQKRTRTWIKPFVIHGLLIASYTTIFLAYMATNFKNHHPNYIYCMFSNVSTVDSRTLTNIYSPGKESC